MKKQAEAKRLKMREQQEIEKTEELTFHPNIN